MKIIVDVNLAVRWADMLSGRGIEAVHWSKIGAANVVDILHKHSSAIEQGTIITIDPNKTRLHILPFTLPAREPGSNP